MSAGPFTPTIPAYQTATSLQSTDLFLINRTGVGTMNIAGSAFTGAGVLSPGTYGDAGQIPQITVNASGNISNITGVPTIACPTFVINEGGAVLITGIKGDLYIPFSGTITAWTLLADQSGSITVDIWKAPIGSYPPTIANTITASALPTLSSASHATSTTLTGWTTTISAGDTLRFNVTGSITNITRVTLALTVAKS